MNATDCIISFQEARTGLPVTGSFADHEHGWRFDLDDCAEEWALSACPTNAAENLEVARKECRQLTAAVRGLVDPNDVCWIVRKRGHSAEII